MQELEDELWETVWIWAWETDPVLFSLRTTRFSKGTDHLSISTYQFQADAKIVFKKFIDFVHVYRVWDLQARYQYV